MLFTHPGEYILIPHKNNTVAFINSVTSIFKGFVDSKIAYQVQNYPSTTRDVMHSNIITH